jgi:hypothetical protein
MRFSPNEPPRHFQTGVDGALTIADCGDLRLSENEQVSFVTDDGKRHDFAAKSWGFYATPSINGRLRDQGFKTALVRNGTGRRFVMVVDSDRMGDFLNYCLAEAQEVEEWLDDRPVG